MNEQRPSLPGMRNDGATLKPDELAGKVITVLSSQTVLRRDGSTGHKWLVQHDDGTLGLYWAPGMAPPQQVAMFFRLHPHASLRLLVERHENGDGFAKWNIQEMVAPDEPVGSTADSDVDQVPF